MERQDPGEGEWEKDKRGEYVVDSSGDREPSTLSTQDTVRADNWAEHERQGVVVVDPFIEDEELPRWLEFRKNMFGPNNLLTGEPFDTEMGVPVAREGGKGIYTTPSGMEYWRQLDAYRREQEASENPGGPEAETEG